MTDIYIISGFLGAGKTTLIKTMVRSAFRNKEIVVIENDFGEAGIDAGLLRECNLAVTSLSDGCICCSLTGDFEKAIERVVKEYAPEAVLVEPSGVGKLSDIIKICFKQEDKGCHNNGKYPSSLVRQAVIYSPGPAGHQNSNHVNPL